MEDECLHRKQHLAAPFRLFACYGFDEDEMQLRQTMEVYSSLTHVYPMSLDAMQLSGTQLESSYGSQRNIRKAKESFERISRWGNTKTVVSVADALHIGRHVG